jgi:hypothetical protein
MKRLLFGAVVAAFGLLAVGVAQSADAGPQVVDACGPFDDLGGDSETLMPENLDLCAASVGAHYEGGRLVLDLAIRVFGDLGDRANTAYAIGWTDSDDCRSYVEIRDAAPVSDASAITFKYACAPNQVFGTSSLSPDTCVRAIPFEGNSNCFGDGGPTARVPDTAVTVDGGTLRVELDIADVLPAAQQYRFAPGARLNNLYATSYTRVGPYRQYYDSVDGCILASCFGLHNFTDMAASDGDFVVPAPPPSD